MALSFTGPTTGKKLKAKDDAAGKKLKCPACGQLHLVPTSSASSRATEDPELIRRLWNEAKTLGESKEYAKAVELYSKLLTLVDESSMDFDICAILRNRAISNRALGNHDAALADLSRELEIAQRNSDEMRVRECRKTIQQTNEQIQLQATSPADRANWMRANWCRTCVGNYANMRNWGMECRDCGSRICESCLEGLGIFRPWGGANSCPRCGGTLMNSIL